MQNSKALRPARKGSGSPLPHTVPGWWWQGHKQDLVSGALSPGVMGPHTGPGTGTTAGAVASPWGPAEGPPCTGRSQGPSSALKCWDSRPISGSGAWPSALVVPIMSLVRPAPTRQVGAAHLGV